MGQAVLGQLEFTEKQVELLAETAKALLPLCTGYIVFAAPLIRFLWAENYIRRPFIRASIILSFALGVSSIGSWTGVFAFLIEVANAFRGREVLYTERAAASLNADWSYAIFCAQAANVLFFMSIAIFGLTSLAILLHPAPAGQKSNDAGPSGSAGTQ